MALRGWKLREMIELLIAVQDDLGKFNDRHIQIGLLKAFIEQSDNAEAITASQQLTKTLEQQQREAGRSFMNSYAAFTAPASQDMFKEMFVDYYGRQK